MYIGRMNASNENISTELEMDSHIDGKELCINDINNNYNKSTVNLKKPETELYGREDTRTYTIYAIWTFTKIIHTHRNTKMNVNEESTCHIPNNLWYPP